MITLEERLCSRFEWGLIVDLQPPDLETRIAILRSKAERANKEIPADILELIARKIQSNIRELEGALTRVLAYAELSGLPITQALVNSALADLLPQHTQIEPDQVVDAVASAFGVTIAQLKGRDRSREIALPRQIAMYLLREQGNASLPQIGAVLGGRDHTTVMYACDKVADLIERDDRLRKQIFAIRENMCGHPQFA
jgi:chromosomal replication initiator protein